MKLKEMFNSKVCLYIIICTFNRKDYLLKNLDILTKQCKEIIKKIVVIDNSSNLKLGNRYSDIVKVIKNKNLGGSGGYARGFLEVSNDPKCTHILLMDDDIEFSPAVLKNAFIRINEIGNNWLGFGMMPIGNSTKLFETSAYWTGISIKHNNRNLDICSEKELNYRLKYNYSAWWSLIMPASVIKNYGYPFPFFIKFDDIEYGLRRKKESIIFEKNIYVKHEAFRNKYNPLLEYYNTRNSLITNAIHFKFGRFLSLARYVGKFAKFYLRGKFKAIKMSNLGCKEYFLGPCLFINNNIESINNRIVQISNQSENIFKSIFVYPFITIFYCFKILFKFNKTKKDYLEKYKYLTSKEFWLKQISN